MSAHAFRYLFADDQTFAEAEDSLRLALLGAEGLYGAASVRLNLQLIVSRTERTFLIVNETQEGQGVNRMLTQFLLREFDEGMFVVEPVRVTALNNCTGNSVDVNEN